MLANTLLTERIETLGDPPPDRWDTETAGDPVGFGEAEALDPSGPEKALAGDDEE
jgi:hypothetical protein